MNGLHIAIAIVLTILSLVFIDQVSAIIASVLLLGLLLIFVSLPLFLVCSIIGCI